MNIFKRIFKKGKDIKPVPIQKRINNIYVRSYLKNERKRWATTKGTNQLLKYS